jgi:hypothetical protein
MCYLSGAINVLLFLMIRPGLLLFPRPRQLDEQEMQLTTEPTSAALKDEGFRDSATPSHVNSIRISVDI